MRSQLFGAHVETTAGDGAMVLQNPRLLRVGWTAT